MSDASANGSSGLQADLEGIIGQRTRPEATDGEPERPPAPVVVLLPRDVPRRRQRPGWVVPSAATLAVVAVAGGAFAIGRSTSRSPAAVAAPTTVATTVAPVVTTAAPPTVATTIAPPAAAPVAERLEPRSAVFAGGKVYLRGAVPDRATADAVVARAGSVVGAANVVDEYIVHPDAPRVVSAPLRVADTVQFAPGSAVVATEFRGLLDLGVNLMRQYPKVTITVVGHTDSAGDDADNQALSQRRVDAVVSYVVSQGIDKARLTGVARGEAEPLAGNDTPEGRRLNRRIEFVITGLLD